MRLNYEKCHELFEVVEGKLIRKVSTGPNGPIGEEAGWLCQTGYRRVKIDDKTFITHRVIFLMYNNHLPKCIDHIDGNPLNNKPENLRGATNGQNRRNTQSNKNSSSVYKGVCWKKSRHVEGNGKWVARYYNIDGGKHLGYYKDEMKAAVAVDEYNRNHHPEFATFNFPLEGERSAI